MKYEDLRPEEIEPKAPERAQINSAEQAEKQRAMRDEAEKAANAHSEKLRTAREAVKEETSRRVEKTRPDTKEHYPKELSVNEAKAKAYKQSIYEIRQHLGKSQMIISNFIHRPVVEKVSDITAKTIARPSLTLGAASFAFMGGGFLYAAARYYGFALSGSEFLAAGALGAILGLFSEGIFQLAKRLIKQT